MPARLYTPVVKKCRCRRLVQVSQCVGFGSLAGGTHALAPPGRQIHTAFMARVTRTIRQPVAAVGRRVIPRCKGERAHALVAGLTDQGWT